MPPLPLAVGFDIGGTETKLALVVGHGTLSDFHRAPTRLTADPQPFLAEVEHLVLELVAAGGQAVIGIGISVHGTEDGDDPRCSMGHRGCADLCGTPGIERLAQPRTGRVIPANQVIAGAWAGDSELPAIIRQVDAWLVLALVTLSAICLPERITLRGGVSGPRPVLRKAVELWFRGLVGTYHGCTALMTSESYRGIDICLGEMSGQSGVVGAVAKLLAGTSPVHNDLSK